MSDLDELEYLRELTNLKELVCYDNPICELDDYEETLLTTIDIDRFKVLKHMEDENVLKKESSKESSKRESSKEDSSKEASEEKPV